METIYLDDFLSNGIIKEQYFRELVDKMDWSNYKGKRVLIKGCTTVPIPSWTYLIITAELSQYARQIFYGEQSRKIKIFVKK